MSRSGKDRSGIDPKAGKSPARSESAKRGWETRRQNEANKANKASGIIGSFVRSILAPPSSITELLGEDMPPLEEDDEKHSDQFYTPAVGSIRADQFSSSSQRASPTVVSFPMPSSSQRASPTVVSFPMPSSSRPASVKQEHFSLSPSQRSQRSQESQGSHPCPTHIVAFSAICGMAIGVLVCVFGIFRNQYLIDRRDVNGRVIAREVNMTSLFLTILIVIMFAVVFALLGCIIYERSYH